jgi:hypothetical protein
MLQRYIKIFYQKVKINFFINYFIFIFAEIKCKIMEAKELRISNLVHLIADGHENEPDLLIWELEDYEFYENKMEYIKPIPLTEEWLGKCYFKFKELGLYNFSISNHIVSKRIFFTIDGYAKQIYYLHQLQNLYFALTGTELTIK